MSPLRLATRGSPLALVQAESVRAKLGALGVEAELVVVETGGDARAEAPLAEIGGEGVFAVEVQRAVLDGAADVAVHSAKDLPSATPDGLYLVGATERADAADVLVGRSLAGLGPGATVATGSPRRRALLLERRPDLRVVGLRGNMARRLAAAGQGGVDAVVAAAAALERLGEAGRVAERLDPHWFVPQVGQGAVAVEVRLADVATLTLLERVVDADATRAVEAERAFLRELGTGCSIPAGAHAIVAGGEVTLRAVMVAIDGATSVRDTITGPDAREVGRRLALLLRDERGGADLPGWRA
ncbi:MAG: hydroxymethylbilane synthase [Acidobacteriota bacterium]|nr:hydroxymethylbilane synthase [Acidobacteriota bacterium]